MMDEIMDKSNPSNNDDDDDDEEKDETKAFRPLRHHNLHAVLILNMKQIDFSII